MHKLHNSNSDARRVPTETVFAILEGIWDGIIVSGVVTISAYLIKCAFQYFIS